MSKSDIKHRDINFKEFSNKYISQIDNTIKIFFQDKIRNAEFQFVKDLYPYLENFCLREGKRIRPLLLILGYLGYSNKKKNIKSILRLASVMEIMHSFLLIQDDIIDKSILRRGKKTVHVLCQENYGEKTTNKNIGSDMAIVLTDVLISNAIEIISNVNIDQKVKNELFKVFAWTFELTAWGQILDSLNSSLVSIDIDSPDPILISTLKTAHYTIASPLIMGSKLAGMNNKKEENLLRDFAVPLGLAFQIKDDILGVFGIKEEIGKSSDSDILEGKHTLLIQNTIKSLNEDERNEFIGRFTKERKNKSDIIFIKKMIKVSGALESSHQRIKELVQSSGEKLEKLKIKDKYKSFLFGFSDLLYQIKK